jgi:WhiB family redox-sensing transcriptional regulator
VSSLDWMGSAACRDEDPDTFFPTSTGVRAQQQVQEAARICAGCPVQVQCGQHRAYTGASTGVWGGTYRNIKDPAAGRALAPINHGTPAGYAQHVARKSPPCHNCRTAHMYANRKWDRR